MNRAIRFVPLVLATALSLAACGGDDDESDVNSAPPPAVTSAPSGTTEPTPTSSASATPSASPMQKVSANDATEDEIAAALAAAGVPNPAKWADEVVEYRPYPKDDPDFARLRSKLAKYNPGEGVVDKIVSALTP